MYLVLLPVPYREDKIVLQVYLRNVGGKFDLRVKINEEKFLKSFIGCN
jgi:hypothetical protein